MCFELLVFRTTIITTLLLTSKVDSLYTHRAGKIKQELALTVCSKDWDRLRQKLQRLRETELLPEEASRGVWKSLWSKIKVPHCG